MRSRGWMLDIALLLGLVAAVYFSRMTVLTLRGEETRRAQVAVEMLRNGQWVVPTEQGNPIFMSSRPPLQNWIIAGLGAWRGQVDVLAIRLPSALAILLLVLLIYVYASQFLNRLGAFTAAAAYATTAQVQELSRLGETDSLFALFVAGSLLLWHLGWVRGWPRWRTWMIAYFFVSLGTLTKGLQAPAYFAGGVGAYLLATGRWRDAFTWAHLAGILVLLAIWNAWQIPYFLETGWAGIRHVYTGDVVMYVRDRSWTTILGHLAGYPFRVLLGSLLPYSLLLVLYARRDFRAALGRAKDMALFLTLAILVAFPTVWLPSTAKTRFFLSMYPCFMPLVGLVVERCSEPTALPAWRRFWKIALGGAALGMAATGLVILGISLIATDLYIAQPTAFALSYAVAGLLLGAACLASARRPGVLPAQAAVLATAAFLGLTYTGVIVNMKDRSSYRETESAVAELKQRLPEGARLKSFSPVGHPFAYYYGEPIALAPWPKRAEDIDPELDYFCCESQDLSTQSLPFAFETIAVVYCDRYQSTRDRGVIIGRRLDGITASAGAPTRR